MGPPLFVAKENEKFLQRVVPPIERPQHFPRTKNCIATKWRAFIGRDFLVERQRLFAVQGQKLEAQVLATALAVYVTNSTLDNTLVAARYGFTVSGDGVGSSTFNVGSSGDAFGVANNSTWTVMDLLLATNHMSANGRLYNNDTTTRTEANNVYSAINQAGDIS